MGLYISFAGMVTYKSAQNLRDVAAAVPLERLLVETDSPYLAPVPMRGKRNEPAYVVHTGHCLAGVCGVTAAVFAQATTANARALFRLPPG
jgi:TatD DNase family protein